MSTPRPPKANRMIIDLDRALHRGLDQVTALPHDWEPQDMWLSLLEETRILVKQHKTQAETIEKLMAQIDDLEARLEEAYQ